MKLKGIGEDNTDPNLYRPIINTKVEAVRKMEDLEILNHLFILLKEQEAIFDISLEQISKTNDITSLGKYCKSILQYYKGDKTKTLKELYKEIYNAEIPFET